MRGETLYERCITLHAGGGKATYPRDRMRRLLKAGCELCKVTTINGVYFVHAEGCQNASEQKQHDRR